MDLFIYTFSDSVTDEVVGTHFIDLSQISNDGANGQFTKFILRAKINVYYC